MMKKYSILIFLFGITLAHSQITVCNACEVSTIEKAINLAKNGDTIFIKKGIYKENDLLIDKSVTIVGEEGAVLDGQNISGVLIITADDFVLKNVKIINVGVNYIKDNAAVKISKIKNFTIENIVLKDVFFGILIEKSHHGKILNNTISSIPKG